jgi:type 1 glutamine amidotransferase
MSTLPLKKSLIVWGGWEGHEPQKCAEFFAAELPARGFQVELSNTLSSFDDAAALAKYDLIIPMWTMGTLTAQQETNLVDTVKAGTGLAGFHGGMGDAFRGSINYQWMVGGQFVAHPDNLKDYTVNIVNRGDPITEGISDFSVHTEQYYMLVDPRNEVLATSVARSNSASWTDGVIVPCVWKKVHGQGRVFYSALGHKQAEFSAVPEQLEITLRGIVWAARE